MTRLQLHIVLASLVLVVAGLPDGCGACPDQTIKKQLWIAALPTPCELIISREGGIVSYTATCGDPGFHMLEVCIPKLAEHPTTESLR